VNSQIFISILRGGDASVEIPAVNSGRFAVYFLRTADKIRDPLTMAIGPFLGFFLEGTAEEPRTLQQTP